LALFEEIEEKIQYLESLILASLDDDYAEEIAICTSVPGISSTAAMTILAEVGGCPRLRLSGSPCLLGRTGTFGVSAR
jgi:transposase